MRALGRGLLIIVGLIVVALVAVYFNLARIVKREVQKEGTRSMRLETTLDRARIALFGGNVDLHDLAIASPRGFSAPKMFQIGDIAVAVTYGELRKHPIHVASLKIEKPKLVIEQSGGAINFRKAMELMPAGDPNKPPMKLVIDHIEVKDAQVIIRPGLPGVQDEIDVAVPELAMKDVGRGAGAKNGAAIKDVAMQVMTALAEKAAQSDKLPVQLKALLHLNSASIVSKLGTDAIKNAADQVPAAKALEGLLPAGRSPKKR
ncbi:MAG: hypothetical protein ABR567_13895 [Myxococcales bacterium]|nr:AsmA family protein [Myxococcales bacterium]